MDWNVHAKNQNNERVYLVNRIERQIERKEFRFYTDDLGKGKPFIQMKEEDFKYVMLLLDTGYNNNVLLIIANLNDVRNRNKTIK